MAKAPRSERWQYLLGAVARQPEFETEQAPQPVLEFPDPSLSEIARSARDNVNATAVAIAIDTGGGMVCRARAGESAPDLGAPVDRDRGITGRCVSTASVIRCADTANDPSIDRAFSERMGVRSILAVPIIHSAMVVGVIVAFFAAPNAFDDDSVTRLERFAREVGEQVFGAEEQPAPAPVEPAVVEPVAEMTTEELPPTPTATPSEPEIAEPVAVEPVVDPEPTHVEPMVTEEPPLAEDRFVAESQRFERTPGVVPWIAAFLVLAVVAVVLLVFRRPEKPAAPPPQPTAAAPSEPVDPMDKLRTSAAAGDVGAEYALAHAYRDGTGVAADPAAANKWLRRAAEGGNPDAQLELGSVLEHDRRASRVEAYTWYVIAWQAGKTEAENAIQRLTPRLSAKEIAQVRYNVAKAYASGQALPHDAISAYVWYSLADWGGDAKARDRLRELEQQLTPQQLAEAKSRADTWIRRHTAPANTTAATTPQ